MQQSLGRNRGERGRRHHSGQVFSWPEIPEPPWTLFRYFGAVWILDLILKVFPNPKASKHKQTLRLLQSSEVLEVCSLKTGWLPLWPHFYDIVILDQSFLLCLCLRESFRGCLEVVPASLKIKPKYPWISRFLCLESSCFHLKLKPAR